MTSFFRKIFFLIAFLPLAGWAQNGEYAGEISGNRTETEALATFLQQKGILGAQFTFSPSDVGFDIDTADPRYICCDALFKEVLRSHLTSDQLLSVIDKAARRMPITPDSTAIQQAVLYTPFTAGSFLFVLVENPAAGSRSALLAVLKNEGGNLTLIEKSPLCRARRSASDDFRK